MTVSRAEWQAMMDGYLKGNKKKDVKKKLEKGNKELKEKPEKDEKGNKELKEKLEKLGKDNKELKEKLEKLEKGNKELKEKLEKGNKELKEKPEKDDKNIEPASTLDQILESKYLSDEEKKRYQEAVLSGTNAAEEVREICQREEDARSFANFAKK